MKSSLACTVLAGAFAFAGQAEAANIITNGSFETGTSGTTNPADVTGWTGVGKLYNHPYSGLQGTQLNAVPDIANYSYGLNNDVLSPVGTKFHGLGGGTQTIMTSTFNSVVSNGVIDAAAAQFSFSAWLTSYTSDGNIPALSLQFYDADSGAGALLGTFTLDRGVTTNQITTAQFLATGSNVDGANNATTDPDYWALYKVNGTVPIGTRSAVLSFVAGTGHAAASQNDWYADSIVLDVTQAPEPSVALLSGLGVLGLMGRRRRN